MPYICTRNRETTVNRKKQKDREISSVGSEHLPYKQGVGGSNPSSPTLVEALQKCKAFLFVEAYCSCSTPIYSIQNLGSVHKSVDLKNNQAYIWVNLNKKNPTLV